MRLVASASTGAQEISDFSEPDLGDVNTKTCSEKKDHTETKQEKREAQKQIIMASSTSLGSLVRVTQARDSFRTQLDAKACSKTYANMFGNVLQII